MKIYVASSWRNTHQPEMVRLLRANNMEVYDFRNPRTGGPYRDSAPEEGFSWKQCDPNYKDGDLIAYREMLKHPRAIEGFNADFNAMKWADVCVLVMPSGRSAHVEAGWMAGQGKKLVVYHPPATQACPACGGIGRYPVHPNQFSGSEEDAACFTCAASGRVKLWNFDPELMYLVGGGPEVIALSHEEVLDQLGRLCRTCRGTGMFSIGMTRDTCGDCEGTGKEHPEDAKMRRGQ